jgi:hypothetical protein
LSRVKQILRYTIVGLFALYQVVTFFAARADKSDDGGPVPSRFRSILWMANWHMFTHATHRSFEVFFEAESPTGWKRLPMHRWYPSKFGEGRYRWERPSVQRSPTNQSTFLAAACRHTDAARVRMVRERWRNRLGPQRKTRRGLETSVIRVWRCDQPTPRPGGMVL